MSTPIWKEPVDEQPTIDAGIHYFDEPELKSTATVDPTLARDGEEKDRVIEDLKRRIADLETGQDDDTRVGQSILNLFAAVKTFGDEIVSISKIVNPPFDPYAIDPPPPGAREIGKTVRQYLDVYKRLVLTLK